YGYDRIPETRLADTLPPQRGNQALEIEERIRDLLADLGMQEVISHRMTTPEREARRLIPGTAPVEMPYYRIANPISSDRTVLRQSLLASVLEVVERNARISPRLALFEIGPVFLASEESELPEELQTLVLALSGPRGLVSWQAADENSMDFFDLKGIIAGLLQGLHLETERYEPLEHPSFHPGKCARIWINDQPLGVFGELHPQVKNQYELPEYPLLLAEFNLQMLVEVVPRLFKVTAIPSQPPVLEDIAVIVDEQLPAAEVEALIRQTGGALVTAVELFDVYRGSQIGAGKKSLAYSLTYQAADRTLTDKEVAQVRNHIIRRLEQTLGAELRG
ncbi:MAG: hypothetical protein JW862_02565, partial [Anaerolineales bacterium]|nr:hypothetical protein [Anaerolineales bacterium]